MTVERQGIVRVLPGDVIQRRGYVTGVVVQRDSGELIPVEGSGWLGRSRRLRWIERIEQWAGVGGDLEHL